MKEHAIAFVKWIQENCSESDNGKYFLIDDEVPENDYPVEELYNIFIENL